MPVLVGKALTISIIFSLIISIPSASLIMKSLLWMPKKSPKLIIYLISSLINCRFSLNVQSLIMIAVAVVFGTLGGIIGVNKRAIN